MVSGNNGKQRSYLRETWRLGFLIPLTYGKWRIQSLFSVFAFSCVLPDSLRLDKAVATLLAVLCWVFKFIFLPPFFFSSSPSWRLGTIMPPIVCEGQSVHLPSVCAVLALLVSLFRRQQDLLVVGCLAKTLHMVSAWTLGFSCLLWTDSQARRMAPKVLVPLTSDFDILLTQSQWVTAIHMVGWSDSETAFKRVDLMLAGLWNKAKYWH